MEKKPTEIKTLKDGSFCIIDDIPCRVVDISISKPGKHGGAKARLTAVGIFTDQKKIIVKPADARIDIPIIEKRAAQVVAFSGDIVQIMDMEDYSMSEVNRPEFEIKEGDEVLIWRFGPYVVIKNKK